MTVGCSTHTARILDRDGSTVCAVDQLVSVQWQRILDDVSIATVRVIPTVSCCGCMEKVESWRHRLAIWRDNKLVWDGPIILPIWQSDSEVEITAFDILAWLDARVPHEDRTFTNADLIDVARWLIADGFLPDDPGHTVQIIGRSGVRGDREYEVGRGQTADHLRDLAGTGIDFTAVGSRIVLLPEQFCETVGRLTDADFPDGLQVGQNGLALVTRAIVHGDDELEVYGEAGGIDPYYGLLERVYDEPSIRDDQSAAAAARSRIAAASPTPLFVETTQATLAPETNIDIPQLVPGWCVNVSTVATCRRVTQPLKILAVDVREDGEGETVGVTLAPAGVV